METTREMPFTIYAENTPNPHSMKFVANKMLNDSDPIEYLKSDSSVTSPLALKLFQMPFISGIFIAGNYVTVNKDDTIEWHDVVMELRILITEFLNEGGTVLNQPLDVISNQVADTSTSSEERKELNEMDLKITDILDEYIRPAVEQDGGAISFHSFDEGTLTVNLRGACSGCPSAGLTLKSGIETVLKRLVPEVKEVVALEL
ncbi:MAG TPA: NifU family protein [Flavobacteriales bacterium]|nr:NifU family protein [Flavobacteriales bacterium]